MAFALSQYTLSKSNKRVLHHHSTLGFKTFHSLEETRQQLISGYGQCVAAGEEVQLFGLFYKNKTTDEVTKIRRVCDYCEKHTAVKHTECGEMTCLQCEL